MSNLIPKRQLLEYCDILLDKMIEQRGGLIDPNLLMNHSSGVPLKDVVNFMVSKGHVKLLNHPYILLLPEARDFRRQKTYVKEFDDEYRKSELENMQREDIPREIKRKRILFLIAVLTLILTAVKIATCNK